MPLTNDDYKRVERGGITNKDLMDEFEKNKKGDGNFVPYTKNDLINDMPEEIK